MNKEFTAEQLNEIKMHLSVIQDCINMGGLAPYQANVISRRLNQALDVINKGKTILPPIAKDNTGALDAIEEIRGVMDLFDEGYQWDEAFEENISDNLEIIEKYIKQ